MLVVGFLLAMGTAFAQTAATTQASTAAPASLVFDVASVRPSAAPDMAKMLANLQAGKKPESMHIEGTRATFVYMSLKQLIASAYKMRTYEINCPDWLTTDRFDIEARMPDGATKDDVPAMLQALLVERFKLAAHREMQDQPVLALVIGKNGSKLKEATETGTALDPSIPLKPGESLVDSLDGPIRLMKNADGSTTYNMGERGTFTLRFDSATLSMHMEASSITMKGFAVMMNSLGGGEGRQVVDMTGLTGKYQAAVEFPLMDLMSSLSSQGINIPTRPPSGGSDGAATDPEGGATVSAALAKLGLRMDKSRAQVQRLVVDHIEKMPTEN
jgi:uncharacterized protein (TIGR03435 family)